MSLFPNFSKYIAGESAEGFMEGFIEGYKRIYKKSNWKLVVIITILLFLIFLY
jgi:hypothetical protein